MTSSQYINDERREFSLYVLTSRAIPSICDGFKPSHRRVLWTARDGQKVKSATLAGATMPIHPHASPEDAVNTLAGPYVNNIPILDGIGAFGTLLEPGSFGAARYTSVKLSSFTKDVVFVDVEIVPMVANYDDTLEEPKHFLPLIPVVLLNPTSGIAVGFKCDILPRKLSDIVTSQIAYLEGSPFVDDVYPEFTPTKNRAIKREEETNVRWTFEGEYTILSHNQLRVTKLPYGLTHSRFDEKLLNLKEAFGIVDYEDQSKDKIDIVITFSKGFLTAKQHIQIIGILGLYNAETEIKNVLDFDHKAIMLTSFPEVVQKFCDWRLQWYHTRYQRLYDLVAEEIQRYVDIITAIDSGVAQVASIIKNKNELVAFLREHNIVNLDYIAQLPIYRFTQEEKAKTQQQLVEAQKRQAEYADLLNNPDKRRKIYIKELKEVLKKYGD